MNFGVYPTVGLSVARAPLRSCGLRRRQGSCLPAGFRRLTAAVLALILSGTSGFTQVLGVTKGFKVLGETFDAPHDTQPRYILEGATARTVQGGNQFLTGVTLQTFRETGQRELLIKAPECLYDRTLKSANSPGPIQVHTADGKFMIEGRGFLWRQTNSTLIISNQVHTVITADMLDPAGGVAPQKPARTNTSPVEITAEFFEYSRDSGVSVYRRNVRVSGTNQMGLASQLLRVHLPVEGRQLQTIEAEEDVTVDYSGVQATGQKANYAAQTGLLRMSGQPHWRADQREGTADELVVDRTNRIFRAEGNAWFKTPSQGASLSGLLSQTNAPARVQSTNQFLQAWSDWYEFRTNWATFSGGVRLKELVDNQVRGTMEAGLLNAAFKGSNQLETLTAHTNVLIQDGTNWLSCGTAVLTGSNGVLEATDSPKWGAGKRSGKGDFIRINTRTNEMYVRGNAALQLPAHELAQTSLLNPGGTNAGPSLPMSTNDFAQIFCEEYTLRPETARFRGGVYATHPRMNWTCEELLADLAHDPGKEQTLTAERSVQFQLAEKGTKVEGTGDKAVYTYGVHNGVTNDMLTLTGSPATLVSTNKSLRNNTIIYDRANNVFHVRGSYSSIVTNKLAGTNLLILPKGKLKR